MDHFYKTIHGWCNFQTLYSKVIKELPYNSHIVEVGCWKGMSTAFLAVEAINSNKNIKIDAVDTWKGSTSPDRDMYINDVKNGDVFKLFKTNIEPVKHIVTPIQMPSVEASKLYKEKSLDFVFIDANHNYESAKEDFLSWLPKIKKGGFIGGHDYKFKELPGVTQAVDEVFKNYNIETIIGDLYDDPNYNVVIVNSFLVKL